MKYLKYIACAATGLLLCGCDDYLDFDESEGMTKDQAYATFENINRQAAAIYRYLPYDFGDISDALREAATDNGMFTQSSNDIYDIYNDKWSPINLIDDQWDGLYSVIRDANVYLENYNEDALEKYKWDPSFADNMAQLRLTLYQVRALRALYFFELVKRYGDAPLATRSYKISEINSLEKAPAQQIFDFIDSECKAVAGELPLDYNNVVGKETGRVTRGAALAFRARALLYAASPLFNKDNSADLWKKAADAAADVINLDKYYMPAMSADPIWKGDNDVFSSPQLIFEYRRTESNDFEEINFPIGGFGEVTIGRNVPTQNLVDEFEMLDGSAFDWNNADHVKNMYYDAAGKPTRDPRFYNTVLCNGRTFQKITLETFEGGRNGAPLDGATTTGYYLKKLVDESVTLDPTNPVKKRHHYPGFRYAELLLNYAEAMNEWQGPNFTDGTHPISALEALNEVRGAAGMPAVSATGQSDFRTKVRHERRIELAFEDHRFWDIRRWKTGDVVKNIYGVNITKDASGNLTSKRVLVQTRAWNDKMYFFPIPQKETFVNHNLTQNPGW